MQELIIYDERLLPNRDRGKREMAPVGNEVLRVDENTLLDSALLWIQMKSRQYGGDVSLTVMAHGDEPLEEQHSHLQFEGDRVSFKAVFSQGGGGAQFCREGINLDTINRFASLSNRPRLAIGKVKKIEFRCCAMAYITAGREGHYGDGNYLCYRLAQIAQTYVRASTAAQPYSWAGMFSSHLYFGRWVGTVTTYSPEGSGVPDYPPGIR